MPHTQELSAFLPEGCILVWECLVHIHLRDSPSVTGFQEMSLSLPKPIHKNPFINTVPRCFHCMNSQSFRDWPCCHDSMLPSLTVLPCSSLGSCSPMLAQGEKCGLQMWLGEEERAREPGVRAFLAQIFLVRCHR